jgi:hypothetical protein
MSFTYNNTKRWRPIQRGGQDCGKLTKCLHFLYALILREGFANTSSMEVPNLSQHPVITKLGPVHNLWRARKMTVIIFKMFGIERAWQNQGCVGPHPHQLFVTKSRLLSKKVEEDYVSLSAGPEELQHVRERIKHWNLCQKETLNPDDLEGEWDDLPEK